MSIVLACDLGGTSFRAALVDDTGAIRAQHAIAGPVSRDDRLGASEIEPDAWWTLLVEACARLAAEAPALFDAIEAVAICGVTRTQVFLGGDGRSLRPTMTWKDTRADALAVRLRERLDPAHPENAAVNAFHPLARLAWLREQEQEAFGKLACLLEPKDYLNFRLTGRRASDPVSMARLLAAAASHDGRGLLAAAGIPASILPEMLEPWDEVAPVESGLPAPLGRLAGKPVFCASNDTWAAVVGLGAMREGFAYNISGTTEVLGVVGREPARAEGLLTVDWRGLFQLGGPSQTGADTVSWLLALLGRDGAAVGQEIDALLSRQRDSQPLLFLPYLQGERVPYWDPSLRGALIGLNRRHEPTDLAYAVLEGVACLNRIVLERAETALGREASEIRFGGGAAANPVWSQIKADLCGRPVVVAASREPGLLGAAIIAFAGLGRFASLADAQQALVTVARRFEPDPARKPVYDVLFSLFRRAEAALAPISRDLVAGAHESGALADLARHASAATSLHAD
ncbi:Xylulokinase [Bosea sp. 62]|uniref:xylulokinase n=1 Tax=unclassified Bosea (in: a-proteobacteria) TaxID=2653178 RepID=UPI001258C67F|nr:MULTISPECIES: FGGY-family carbohydrate kinase [unclassified Bosea (in: a-proteobacteria)]CAD5288828.1 Xylulokinase [Bosea sp. 21B]CAD5291166.1 Xylulokinase [Bosea sp. 46]CAD5300757.1 Xylulokinase [Bosea sp. 7B]VVT60306.1 Xylulokinase [Bosea sp. EC-HK365B]VXA95200.1 Xylulokinase [Bosea sp. 62]